MEFGRINVDQLSAINFSLPSDPQHTVAILKQSGAIGKSEIFIGCSRWGHKTWVGKIYPPLTKDKEFLQEYVKHFNAVESKSTFYQTATYEQVTEWEAKTRSYPSFKFYPLMPQSITHIRRLKNADHITATHLASLTAFGKKLGPSLLQLGQNFSPRSFKELQAYLMALPQNFRLFIEMRHKDWFTDKAFKEVLELLSAHNIGLAITDTPGRRDAVHMNLTVPHAYVRFSASGDDHIDRHRLKEWSHKIKNWEAAGMQSIGFFISHNEPRYEPELSLYLKECLK
ncbi:MAG: DUF72 domain-containing protein [Mucilaginibacter sp.]|uniref:DUF72 domain-containing protein n=1 Tax=Mucilaginibacter sp. TaxID=1882438 RepID=UPI00319ED47F